MGERRKHASLVQKNRILDLLDQRLERLGNGLVRYVGVGEHSDESIAAQVTAELPPPISKANVRNLRRSHFGELRHVTPPEKPDPPPAAPATSAEVAAMRAQLDRLEKLVSTMNDRLTQLTKTDIELHDRLRRIERTRAEQLSFNGRN